MSDASLNPAKAAVRDDVGHDSADSHNRWADVSWLFVLIIAGLGPLLTSNLTAFGMRYPLTYDQHLLLRAVLVAVCSFAALGFASLSGDRGMPTSVHRWPMMGFIALMFVSAGFSEWRGVSVFGDYAHYEGVFMFLAYVSLMAAVTQTVTDARLRLLARTIVVVGGVLSLYGLAQMLGADPTNWLSTTFTLTRTFATWGNPDFFGMYLVLPLSFSAVLAFSDESLAWRRLSAGIFGLVVLSLIGTVTRGAWLAGAVAIIVIVVGLTRSGWRPLRWQSAGIVGLAVAAFVAVGGTHRVVSRVSSLAVNADTGVSSRFDIWRSALYTAGRSPLYGGGPDTFVESMTRHFPGANVSDAHNWLLQIAVTVGFPAALVLAWFFLWALSSTARRVIKPGPTATDALKLACWGAAAGLLVALALGVSQTVSTALLFCCVGVLLRDVAQFYELPRFTMWFSAVLMLSFALASAVFGGIAITADAHMMQARALANDRPKETAARLAHAQEAVELNPLYARYREELLEARQAAR